ncbi:MAG: carbon-nitrogen hydrolase family protein [Planctomycetes bacterium]|nr:carbon-nitrogen hydrolase family protein [Planctomycetota bacterium]
MKRLLAVTATAAAALVLTFVISGTGSAAGTGGGEDSKQMVDRTNITVSTITIGLHDPTYEGPRTSKAERLEMVKGLLDIAGERGSDIVCLPEEFNAKHTTSQGSAEEIPAGETSQLLSQAAKKWKMYVVGCLREKKDGQYYIAVPFFDREGKHIGTYHKVHLPGAVAGHKAPADSFKTIQTDFCKVGAIVCYDIHFPEGVRCLALNGAEIVFWPTMYSEPRQMTAQILARARAIENNIFFVPSNYSQPCLGLEGVHTGFSAVIDRQGEILAHTGRRQGVATAVINLDDKRYISGAAAAGGWQGSRVPETYGRLLER